MENYPVRLTLLRVTFAADVWSWRSCVLLPQGGPGGSGSGFGNFEEIGPLDRDLQPRKTSWVRWCFFLFIYFADFGTVSDIYLFIFMCVLLFFLQLQATSLLFVDNPVGTGFSYVEESGSFATNVSMVASDMLVLLKHFFTERSEFQVRQLTRWQWIPKPSSQKRCQKYKFHPLKEHSWIYSFNPPGQIQPTVSFSLVSRSKDGHLLSTRTRNSMTVWFRYQHQKLISGDDEQLLSDKKSEIYTRRKEKKNCNFLL